MSIILKVLVVTIAVIGGTTASTVGQHTYIEKGETVTVTDSWVLDSTLCIGRDSSRNHLEVKNGGNIDGKLITLGILSGADKNQLTVSGDTTSITCTSLTIGSRGSRNVVSVRDGAKVSSGGAVTIGGGWEGSTKKNSILVSGSSSHLSATYINVGLNGSDNTLTLEKGATIQASQTIFVGRNRGAKNNCLSIAGSGSTLLAQKDIYVGYDWEDKGGTQSALSVLDGAVLEAAEEIFSRNDSSVTVGINSTVKCNEFSQGDQARLEVRDGGNLKCAGSFTQNNASILTLRAGGTLSSKTFSQMKRSTLEVWIGAEQQSGQIVSLEKIEVAGTLRIKIIPEAQLHLGDTFQIFNGSIKGKFLNLDAPPPPKGLSWDGTKFYSEGIISLK